MIGAVLCALPLPAVSPAVAAPAAGPAECRASSPHRDAIATVGARGELQLASGARAVLGSIRWPDEPGIAAAAHAWLVARTGRPLTLSVRGEADRWGRSRVDALLADDAAAPDLAGGLVAAGLALADADEGDVLCRPALLAVEEGPRAAGVGVWAGPAPAAGDGPALRARAGRFAVVTGRLRHVGERRARTYLDFAARGEDGLTVTVSKRTWRRVLERGLTAAGLKGRRVRVRGILEVRHGPALDVASAEAVEVLDDGPAAAPDAGDGERAPRR